MNTKDLLLHSIPHNYPISILLSKYAFSLQPKLAQYRLWIIMIRYLTFIQEGSISFLPLLSHVYDDFTMYTLKGFLKHI